MMPEKPSQERLARLADRASDLEPSPPPAPVATGAFWNILDHYGLWLAYGAAGLCILSSLLALWGGPDFAWVSILYLPVLIMLLLYIPYLLRRHQQERAAEYLLRQQAQEQARLEVARLVVEQSQVNSLRQDRDINR